MTILQWPIKPIDHIYITQLFGERPEVYKKYAMQGHNGLDFRTSWPDTPNGWRHVYAATDGKVTEVKDQGEIGYGLYIRLQHEKNAESIYGHLKRVYINQGDKVHIGDRIGLTDNTGDSTGTHLHFGYRPADFNYNNGYKGYIDPLPYMQPLIEGLNVGIVETGGDDSAIVNPLVEETLKLLNDISNKIEIRLSELAVFNTELRNLAEKIEVL